jgi:hypothetical protein
VPFDTSQTSKRADVSEPIASALLIKNQEHDGQFAQAFIVASKSRSRREI